MRVILAAIFACALAPAAEPAGRVPVIAELFTSEGCSSCPPADTLLMQLDQAQPVAGAQIIVLSEHVDYWNQLGWKDPFSAAQYSLRQSAYARTLGAEVYTPQIVIDGREAVLGSDPRAIQAAVGRAIGHAKSPLHISEVKREGGEAVVTFTAGPLAKGHGDLWLAIADESQESSVSRGENSGHKLRHVAVVRHLTRLGAVPKAAGPARTVRIPAGAGANRVVVFVQDSIGPVLAADSVSLK